MGFSRRVVIDPRAQFLIVFSLITRALVRRSHNKVFDEAIVVLGIADPFKYEVKYIF